MVKRNFISDIFLNTFQNTLGMLYFVIFGFVLLSLQPYGKRGINLPCRPSIIDKAFSFLLMVSEFQILLSSCSIHKAGECLSFVRFLNVNLRNHSKITSLGKWNSISCNSILLCTSRDIDNITLANKKSYLYL